MAAPNIFVHAVYVSALAFEDHRREETGELYLTHGLKVAQALGPDATVLELATAVLHDVLEDTDWTIEDLAESGVEPTVLEAVETLTRPLDEEHGEFVARICATPGVVGRIAQRVKLADLSVNLASAESNEERQRLERGIPSYEARSKQTPPRIRCAAIVAAWSSRQGLLGVAKPATSAFVLIQPASPGSSGS
jgi:(p)ppGpp synthase/HD superfamily hydrolase